MSEKKLVKINSEKKVAGVCAGIARYFNFDVMIIRLLFVVATIFGVGSPVIIYVILALVMSEE